MRAGPPSGAPVEIRVKGEKVGELESVAELLVAELEKVPGTRDVVSDVEHGTGEFHFLPFSSVPDPPVNWLRA